MSTIQEDFSPIYQSDTGAAFAPQFLHADGTPVNLTGATISMKMQSQDTPATVITCTGTWTIDDAVNGKAHYAYAPTDVATVGMWILFVVVTIGGKPAHADSRLLEIKPAP